MFNTDKDEEKEEEEEERQEQQNIECLSPATTDTVTELGKTNLVRCLRFTWQ